MTFLCFYNKRRDKIKKRLQFVYKKYAFDNLEIK